MGYERRNNFALKIQEREKFIQYMTKGQPPRPANIQNIVAINQGKKPLTMEAPATPALAPEETLSLLQKNPSWQVIDARSSAAFGGGHIPRAVNVQFSSPEFEQRIGWTLAPDTPIVLLLEKDADAAAALHKMAFIGLDANVRGYLAGGMSAWMTRGLPCKTIPQVSVHQLHQNLLTENGNAWRVVDVREGNEWEEGHIENALLMNFKDMGAGTKDFPFEKENALALICKSGMRSSTGASLLRNHGFENVMNIMGGMTAWESAGFETVT